MALKRLCITLGVVPKELLFDNAKCIMIERDAYGIGQHRWNSQLLQMARDYGFVPKACRPYRARTKGKVERFNGYLKRSFIVPLAATLKQAGLELDVDTANARIGACSRYHPTKIGLSHCQQRVIRALCRWKVSSTR